MLPTFSIYSMENFHFHEYFILPEHVHFWISQGKQYVAKDIGRSIIDLAVFMIGSILPAILTSFSWALKNTSSWLIVSMSGVVQKMI